MTDDRELAELLGEAPRTPDPGFRFDVIALVSAHARRRAALSRAVKQVLAFTVLGLLFPAAQAAGLDWAHAQPIALAIGVTAAAYLLAALTIQGPKPLLARSRALLRAV
jgi:hypothetical protein